MAVNRTSSTATAPRTSFARRDRVGTATGGRMATSALLQLQGCGDPRPGLGRPTDDRAGSVRSRSGPLFIPAQRTAGDGVPLLVAASASGRGPPVLEVRERLQRVVQGGFAVQGKPGMGGGRRLDKVAGGH